MSRLAFFLPGAGGGGAKSETPSTQPTDGRWRTSLAVIPAGSKFQSPATKAVLPTSLHNENNQNTTIVVPKEEYNAKACRLEPAWGYNESGCVGRHPLQPHTTASFPSCDGSKPRLTNHHSQEGMTIALLYFAKPAMLLYQLELFDTYPPDILDHLTVLVIDDGSPGGLQAREYLPDNFRPRFRFRLATITSEKNWNIGGARNLAFYLVDTPRVLLLDLDMLVPRKTMEEAWNWQATNGTHYWAHRFNRIKKTGEEGKHPAVSVLDADAYWYNGGCDEDFCGHYGYTDVHFWWRWKMSRSRTLVDHLDTYLYELDMAACNSSYIIGGDKVAACKQRREEFTRPNKKLNINHARFKAKTSLGCWSNKYLRFRWMLDF